MKYISVTMNVLRVSKKIQKETGSNLTFMLKVRSERFTGGMLPTLFHLNEVREHVIF
jgi:hypothetical protein